MFKSNIEYQECYCMPAHLYSRFLEFLDEETQTELKTLNKRINPNLDFFTKTLKDIEPYSKNTKKNKKKIMTKVKKVQKQLIMKAMIAIQTKMMMIKLVKI